MATTVRNLEPPAPGRTPVVPVREARGRMAAILVTADDSLWPQIGKFVPGRFALRQVDGLEPLLAELAPGSPAVLIWDVRNDDGAVASLSRLQQHSPRLAILMLDEQERLDRWQGLIRQNQVVAALGVPIAEGEFVKRLNQAGEEVLARGALLGETAQPAGQAGPAEPTGRRHRPWALITAIVLAVAAAAYTLLHFLSAPTDVPTAPPLPATQAPPPARGASFPAAAGRAEQVEPLLESAGQAMMERRYLAPADNNALYFYHRVLSFDADNGEAKQGLERLAELLLARAQAAVDAHQYEPALQALETARILKPADPRLASLDQQLSGMRAELGAAQIQAAIAAQNFDRASELIEDAVRLHAIGAAHAAQLREAVKSQRAESEANHWVHLAQARLQQDRLIEPAGDNAAFYLERAQRSGAGAATLAAEFRQLQQRLGEAARAAIAQRQFADAERDIAAAKAAGAGTALTGALQADLAAARIDPPVNPEPAAQPPAAAAVDEATGRAAGAAPSPAPPVLTLLRPLRPEYPREAVSRGTEGWVDLAFTVNADGQPVNVRVVDAMPRGMFDKAATRAVQAARYAPLSSTDPSVTRQVSLRVSFRLGR